MPKRKPKARAPLSKNEAAEEKKEANRYVYS